MFNNLFSIAVFADFRGVNTHCGPFERTHRRPLSTELGRDGAQWQPQSNGTQGDLPVTFRDDNKESWYHPSVQSLMIEKHLLGQERVKHVL